MVLWGGGNRAGSCGVGVGAARRPSVVVLRVVELGLLRCEAVRSAAWGLVLGVATARGLCWRAETHVRNTRAYTRPFLPSGYASVDRRILACGVMRGQRTLHMDGGAGVLFTTVPCVYSPACGDLSP